MADGIDSSEDLKKQFEEFERGELEATEMPVEAEAATATRTMLPPWLKWMVIVDIAIVAIVLLVVFAA